MYGSEALSSTAAFTMLVWCDRYTAEGAYIPTRSSCVAKAMQSWGRWVFLPMNLYFRES